MKRLEFDSILKECRFSRKEIDLAKVVIIGHLISPDSELHTINWFHKISGLNENLSTDISETGKDAFYEIGDVLYANQEKKENTLHKNRKNCLRGKNNLIGESNGRKEY